MKKSALIVSTLALALAPVAAFANPQVQNNVQAGSNTAVTVGTGNVTNQNVSNNATQSQFGLGGYGVDPQIQSNIQAGQNQSFTNGVGNVTVQGVHNNANQSQVDLSGYGIPAYPY